MANMWTVVPTRVRKSKILTAEEKEFYYLLADRLTKGGYCKDTNVELAKMLNVSEKTIQKRLASLQAKKFVNIRKYDHSGRLIFLNIPGEPEDQPKPTEEQLQEKTEDYTTSLQNAIVFGTIDFSVLVGKLLKSPYLENVTDNSVQFLLTSEQVDFLAEFKALYPGKKIDCQLACYPDVDYKQLLREIHNSELLVKDNLSLKWILDNREAILNHKYQKINNNQNFKGRDYDDFDVNSLLQSLDEVVI